MLPPIPRCSQHAATPMMLSEHSPKASISGLFCDNVPLAVLQMRLQKLRLMAGMLRRKLVDWMQYAGIGKQGEQRDFATHTTGYTRISSNARKCNDQRFGKQGKKLHQPVFMTRNRHFKTSLASIYAPSFFLCPTKKPNPKSSVLNVILLPLGKKNTSPFSAFTSLPVSSLM